MSNSDSVGLVFPEAQFANISSNQSSDRVFVHALATVRRLPRTGSSRPPPSARLRLYGLYKQSMEGDVSAILPRPTLPPPSPSLNDQTQPSTSESSKNNNNNNNNSNAVHRYASRDLRTREAQAEIEKWDAWNACASMSRTEAKRRYISTLIETMKDYASGTQESRELVGELEFVWGQIQNQSNSQSSAGSGSGSGSGGNVGDQDSSPRRSGLARMDSLTGESLHGAPSRLGLSRRATEKSRGDSPRLRVLSPVSQREPDDIVEGADEASPDSDTPPQEIPSSTPHTDPQWRTTIESHLRRLSTEIAALREQLSSNHLLSSSAYSPYTYQYHQLSLKWKILYRTWAFLKWAVWAAVRQVAINVILLGAVLIWGRWKRDRRAEEWARRRWKEVRGLLGGVDFGGVGWWRVLRLRGSTV